MTYPTGFFTALVRQHDWPPRFRSVIRVDSKTGRFETPYAAAMRNRLAGGFDRHPVTQPGSVVYVQAGPVEMMTTQRTQR